MKKEHRKSYKILWLTVIGVFFIGSALIFFYFNSRYWKLTLLSYLNSRLEQSYTLRITTESIQGNVFGQLQLAALRLETSTGYTLLTTNRVEINYRLASILFGPPTIDWLYLDGLRLKYPDAIDSLVIRFPSRETDERAGITIRRLVIDHLAVEDTSGQRRLYCAAGAGQLAFKPDGVHLKADTLQLDVAPIGETIAIRQTALIVRQDTLLIEHGEIRNRSALATISGRLLSDFSSGQLNIDLKNLVLNQRLKLEQSPFDDRDYLNLRGELWIDQKLFRTNCRFNGQLKSQMITGGYLQAQYQAPWFSVDSLSLQHDQERLTLNLTGEMAQSVTGWLDVRQIDLKTWHPPLYKTALNARMAFTAGRDSLSNISARVNLHCIDSWIDTLNVDSLKGAVVYQSNRVAIDDTLTFSIDGLHVGATGWVDLATRQMGADCHFSMDDLNLAADMLKIDTLLGHAQGVVEIHGDLENPEIKGWVQGRNLGVKQLHFNEAIARFGLSGMRGAAITGDIYVEAMEGRSSLSELTLPFTGLIVHMDGDTNHIRMLKIRSEDANLELHGRVVRYQDIIIDHLMADVRGNHLRNLSPIGFSWVPDSIVLNPIPLSLNDGEILVSAGLHRNRLTDAKIEFRRIDLLKLNTFWQTSQRIEGLLEGSLVWDNILGLPRLTGDFVVAKPYVFNQYFDKMTGEITFFNDHLTVRRWALDDREKGSILLNGQSGFHFPPGESDTWIDSTSQIDMKMIFENFKFGLLSAYLLPELPKMGWLSGEVAITGSVAAPELMFQLQLLKPVLDRLSGDQLILHGGYRNARLQFDEIVLTDGDDLFKGQGYVPAMVALWPPQAGLLMDEKMDFSLTAHTRQVKFLSAYIDDLNEATGEYNMALNFKGTPRKPVRSGNLIVKNGTIDIAMLENQITNLNGSAVMSGNKMTIVALDGYMLKPRPRSRFERFRRRLRAYTWDLIFPSASQQDAPNLNITGILDFSIFFRPKYDLRITGRDIYFRSLLAEQEGVANINLTVSGRDTINIESEADIIELIVRNEFTGDAELFVESGPNSVYTTINVYANIPGNLYFRNSQLDCELEGEVYIIKNGNQPFRFSGQLDVRKGKFFYYGWEFTDLTGQIIFNPTEFNPTINLQAQVNLAQYGYGDTTRTGSIRRDEKVTVRLTGDFEQPTLLFESNNENISQSDILMFLTRTQRPSQDFFNQEQLSSDAMNAFGAYFERQLEKSVARISGLDEFEIRTKGNLFSPIQPDQMSMVLGQKLAPNLYVKYERTLSLIEPYQQVGVEYHLNRNMSIIGEIDQNGLLKINYRFKYHY